MTSPAPFPRSSAQPPVMPVLRNVWPDAEIPDTLRAALDVRARDKAAMSAMADEVLAQLQSEISRLSQEWVHSRIDQLWRKRFPPVL